jgi:hypothetical protein
MPRTYAANKGGKRCGQGLEEPYPNTYGVFTTANIEKEHITKCLATQKKR